MFGTVTENSNSLIHRILHVMKIHRIAFGGLTDDGAYHDKWRLLTMVIQHRAHRHEVEMVVVSVATARNR